MKLPTTLVIVRPRSAAALGSLLLLSGTALLPAQTTTWRGPASGGEWTTGANWSDEAVPASGSIVELGNASANRLIIYRGSVHGSEDRLDALTFAQASPFVNELSIGEAPGSEESRLDVRQDLTLSATKGGIARIRLTNSSDGTGWGALYIQGDGTQNGQLKIDAGGELVLAPINASTDIRGNVTLAGGEILFERNTKHPAVAGSSLKSGVSGNLTMTGGTLNIAQKRAPDDFYANRFEIGGSFTATGGTIVGGGKEGTDIHLWNADRVTSIGAKVTLRGNATHGGPSFMVSGNNHILTLDATGAGGLYLWSDGRESMSTRFGASTASGTAEIRDIRVAFRGVDNTSITNTLSFTSNVKTTGQTNVLRADHSNQGSGIGDHTLVLDLNGHTLDATSGGIWRPNNAATSASTTWILRSSGKRGTFVVPGIDTSAPNVIVQIEDSVIVKER